MNVLHQIQLAIIIAILASVSILVNIDHAYAYTYTLGGFILVVDYPDLSPYKQLEKGIAPDRIICDEDKLLLEKLSTEKSICVFEETAKELIKRKFAMPFAHLFPPPAA